MTKKITEFKKFKQGDLVEWKSQAHGNWRSKIGVVVSVIKPGSNDVATGENAAQWNISYPGYSRDHESYVVAIVHPHKPTEFFWPRVNGLTKSNRYLPLTLPKKNMTLKPNNKQQTKPKK